MREDGHSLTALSVALRRAAHQLYDAQPLVLTDPHIVPLVRTRYAERLERTPASRGTVRPYSADIRAWVVARSRYAEDLLHARGPAQLLILGAGLETLALRHGLPRLRVFEVDHPATQRWKLEMLREAGVELPQYAVLVPVDFESGASLADELAGRGFRTDVPTAVMWLGVVMYLTDAAFATTMKFLSRLAPGSTLVMDYYQHREMLPEREQLMLDSLAQRVAQAGEPFRMFRAPDEMEQELARYGFAVREDSGMAEINARYFDGRDDALRLHSSLSRLLFAERV